MRSASLLAAVSFLAFFSLFSATALAQQINTYSIDADISGQGNAKVKLVMTFSEPVGRFEALLPISITNFNATSSAGPVVCDNQLDGVSFISCDLQLTEERKTLEMTFESSDLVKTVRGGSVFVGDFSVKKTVRDVFAAVRLPEGMVLSQDVPGGSTVPFSNSTSTDGRRITVVWRLTDPSQDRIDFQVVYEPGITPGSLFTEPSLRLLALLAIMVGGGVGFVFLQRRKTTKDVVFSVLDDYERRVISSIEKAGGVVNQKRVVTDTNLSKAKVSRVVQKLVERGLLQVERRGRTNIVKFSKKKMSS